MPLTPYDLLRKDGQVIDPANDINGHSTPLWQEAPPEYWQIRRLKGAIEP